jgi:transcriptional regulator with XRE-family HTH domain
MSDTEASRAELGRLILTAREAKGWSRQRLAAAAGYDTPNGGITISKIERGLMRPSDERLFKLAEALGISKTKVEGLVQGTKANPLAAAHARRANQQRAQKLNDRTAQLQAEVERYYTPLEEARTRIEQTFLGPFLDYAGRLEGAEEELEEALTLVRATNSADENQGLQADIARNRTEVAHSLGAVLAGATAGGATVGAAAGAGAAFATYSTVAAMATASTGTAISTLAGAAASNATLAALGGGSLATGGLGVAGGTAVLAGIVAAPAVIAAGVALFWVSKKWHAREQDETERIHAADLMFQDTERRVRASFPWTTRALGFLGAAELTSTHLMRQLVGNAKSIEDLPRTWTELDIEQQDAARRLVQLAAVTLTVLPLPALATPDDDLDDDTVDTLEARTAEWNDAVLTDAMACATRVATRQL